MVFLTIKTLEITVVVSFDWQWEGYVLA